jgi:GNAT superfamily N-acetyltransferase
VTYEATGARHAARVEAILRALPEWFGIESSIIDYIEFTQTHPLFFIGDERHEVLGFIGLGLHGEYAAEVHIMAVDPDARRRGLGRKLIEEVERWCRARGIEYLQVKTLDKSRESAAYAQTRRFYEAMGFRLLEVFPTLWDPHNPCALYVKAL